MIHRMGNVIATKHACQQAMRRYRMLLPVECHTLEETQRTLIRIFKVAKEYHSWKMVPFYVNKVGTKHGVLDTRAFVYENMILVCNEKSGNIVIRTVVDRFCGLDLRRSGK